MALKDRFRRQHSKRFGNVGNGYHSKSVEMNFSSSDSEFEIHINKNKVREEFSTKKLLKKSECFTVDSDHIYSTTRPSGTVLDSSRKRKISEKIDEKPVKTKCVSKNAVMARLNRERKKKYVLSLEEEIESLRKENTGINQKLDDQNKVISAMRREILYLKGLLANSKELGQILKNLSETTGLPITSSMISTTQKDIGNDLLENSSVIKQDSKNSIVHQPRIRSVNSGYNFPILDKDINLGSCSENSFHDIADPENYPFDFEKDSYDLLSEGLNDDNSFFNFTKLNSESEFEECLKSDDSSQKMDQKVDPQFGICLHVNQKRISVEMCSVCNGKGESLLGDLPDDWF